MPSAPIPEDESGRQAELDRYAVVATPPEEVFDRITRLASHFFACPVALLSFVEGQRQWFKSCVGIDFREGPRSESFCAWAVLGSEVMVVPDAMADARFRDNPLVAGKAGIRFYAGAPLITPRGFKLGTLCIVDIRARVQGLTPQETAALADLAALAMGALDARLVAQEAHETQHLLRTTLASMGDGVIVTDAIEQITLINPVAQQITGWKDDEAVAMPLQKVFDVVDEASRQIVENPVSRALQQGRVTSLAQHTTLLTRDGRQVAVEDTAAPVFRGERIVGGVLIFRDVTRRRAAEQALEYSENQYRTAFADSPIGLVIIGLDGQFIEANEAYRRLTGYSDGELRSITFLSLTHAEDIEHNRRLFQQLIQGEVESYVIEKRILKKNGAMRWVRAHAALLRDVRGNATKTIGLVEDITEARRAEERFRFLAESIPQMVWTATAEGLIDYLNAQGIRYLGPQMASLPGSQWIDCVHPEDRELALQRWTESVESGVHYETEFRLKRSSDSSWRLHLARALPLSDEGRVTQWFGTFTDIEHRHQAVRQIEDDRRRWRDLLLRTPAAIAVLRGPEHRLEWVNPAYEQLVGRPSSALAGQPALKAFPELAAQMYGDLLDNVYQKGEPFHGHEAFVQLSTGTGGLKDAYINFVNLPTRNMAGEIDGFLLILPT